MQHAVLIALHQDNLSGIVDVARQVVDAGWLVMANKAVAEVLEQHAIPVVRAQIYASPADQDGVLCAMLGHVWIDGHPHSIDSMIYADPRDRTDRSILETCGTPSIELVITNLDPPPLAGEGYIDNLTVLPQSRTWGFHTLLLDTARRWWQRVALIVDPHDYGKVARVLEKSLTQEERGLLADKAVEHKEVFKARVYGPAVGTLFISLGGGRRHGEE